MGKNTRYIYIYIYIYIYLKPKLSATKLLYYNNGVNFNLLTICQAVIYQHCRASQVVKLNFRFKLPND